MIESEQIAPLPLSGDTTFHRPARTPKWGVAGLCAAAAVTLAAGLDGAVDAWLLGASMLVVPGIFVADFVAPRWPTERLVITLAVSLVSWVVIGHLLLTFQWWQPRLVSALVLGLAAVTAALWRAGAPCTRSLPTRCGELIDDIGRPQLIWSAVALGLCAGSLPFIDTNFDD